MWDTQSGETTTNNGKQYADTIELLFDNPGCVSFHLCGAYQRNRARRYGLLDDQEIADSTQVDVMSASNKKIVQRIQNIR